MNTYNEYSQSTTSGNEGEQREGRLARAIEQQTAKIPSDVFMWAAGAAMVGSLAFQILGPRPKARGLFSKRLEGRAPLATFIGQWVPTLLLFGIYNKIVKVGGSDRASQ